MKDVVKSQRSKVETKIINGKEVVVKRRKRRNNMKGIYAIIVMGVAAFFCVLALTVFFNVKEVEINGSELYSYEQILLVGGVNNGGNLLRMNTETVEQRLVSGLPYVEAATVTKVFPVGLKIEITEAKQAASVADGDEYYIVSQNGVVLEAGSANPAEDCLTVIGFDPDKMSPGGELKSKDNLKAGILEEIITQLERLDFTGVTAVDLTDRTDIIMEYDNRITIYLGSSYDMEDKLSDMKAVIDKGITDAFHGTLKYNGEASGISAIPQDVVTTTTTAMTSTPDDSAAATTSAQDGSEPAVTTWAGNIQ